MKTKVTFIAAIILFASFTSMAAVFTVSNSPLGGAQYSSLDAAYNAANNGDTLILEGTNIEYYLASASWNKQLTVIGGGLNTNKENFKKTYIRNNNGWGEFRLGTASGSSFHGISYTRPVGLSQPVSNISFENCEFIDSWYGKGFITFNFAISGMAFRNCIFGQDNGTNLELGSSAVANMSFFSCIFDGQIFGYNNDMNILLFDHCLFLGTNTPFDNLNTATISNSIFMNAYPTSITNGTFLNNICRVAGTLPPAGNPGSGNIENTDPLLVSYTLNSFYSTSHDYDIQAGSPCELAGSDGTDIGVHGGASNFSEQGEPLIAPVVRSVLITTPVVSANGTLSVDVSASKPAED